MFHLLVRAHGPSPFPVQSGRTIEQAAGQCKRRVPFFKGQALSWSMIFSENRYPLFGVML
jgi:hypothetical protein